MNGKDPHLILPCVRQEKIIPVTLTSHSSSFRLRHPKALCKNRLLFTAEPITSHFGAKPTLMRALGYGNRKHH